VAAPVCKQAAAELFTVMKGALKVPFAPRRLGPLVPLHCAVVVDVLNRDIAAIIKR
jgi:hypothetical protein